MRRDLDEGCLYSDIAPFVGWGRIRSVLVRERYISVRSFGWILFVVHCVQYLDYNSGTLLRRPRRYVRWWCRRPAHA